MISAPVAVQNWSHVEALKSFESLHFLCGARKLGWQIKIE